MLAAYFLVGAFFSVLTVSALGLSFLPAIFPGILFAFLYTAALLLLHALFLAIAALFVDGKPVEKDSAFFRWLTAFTIKVGLSLLRVSVKVTGSEKIPEGRFLLVQNHRSAFDPLISLLALNAYQIGFITKPENMEIPVVGKFAHKICCLPIDRENPRNAMKTIREAAEFLENGVCSIGLYPEGTRNSGNGLLPFHNGSMKIATKAGVPIVISTISGTGEIKKNAPFRKTAVEIRICGVLSAEEVKSGSTGALGDKVFCMMAKDLGYPVPDEEE